MFTLSQLNLTIVLKVVSHGHTSVRRCFVSEQVQEFTLLLFANNREREINQFFPDLHRRHLRARNVEEVALMLEELIGFKSVQLYSNSCCVVCTYLN